MTTPIEDEFSIAESITKERAKSFYFASRALDATTRRRAYVTYAFCRRCDDAVDGDGATQEGNEEKVARLARLRDEVTEIYAQKSFTDPVLSAFSKVVRECAIPESAVAGLLEGMRWDLEGRTYRTWDDTLAYCELAAGTVGRMMAAIFDAHQDAHAAAASLGRAMQLTNIVRDVREDFLELGRVYLPEDVLAANGVGREDLARFSAQKKLDGKGADGFRIVAREALSRAESLYREGDHGIHGIPRHRSRATAILMRATYSEIGRAIEERNYDVFSGRAHVPLARKLRASARKLLRSELFAR